MVAWNIESDVKALVLLSKILCQRRGPRDDIANLVTFKLNRGSLKLHILLKFVIFLHCLNFKLKLETNFKLFTESLWKKENRKKRESNDMNNYLIGFLREQFLDTKPKNWGISLYILKVLWELLRCWYTSKYKEKNIYFAKKLN